MCVYLCLCLSVSASTHLDVSTSKAVSAPRAFPRKTSVSLFESTIPPGGGILMCLQVRLYLKNVCTHLVSPLFSSCVCTYISCIKRKETYTSAKKVIKFHHRHAYIHHAHIYHASNVKRHTHLPKDTNTSKDTYTSAKRYKHI